MCSFRRLEYYEKTKSYECFTENYCEKCAQIQTFAWSAFCRIRNEYIDLLCKSPCSVGVRENIDKEKSVFRHFLQRKNIKPQLKTIFFI